MQRWIMISIAILPPICLIHSSLPSPGPGRDSVNAAWHAYRAVGNGRERSVTRFVAADPPTCTDDLDEKFGTDA
jgi:hypothetical protein